ncbi:hypothetical protein BU23DRAFT_573462 [Bimuria novae-zelandiae CBS 107.79]|uniref:Uncharacterized protein n=1 Tax=Bimuria novae-zelandiae CBS 107.79 TaxID=1447943 RepID=A0A6A5UR05_9PLEO|nr:hypothetical protein BU23DRAFT_573462 [Bimuria novae-zelandiae CBS 107.79]
MATFLGGHLSGRTAPARTDTPEPTGAYTDDLTQHRSVEPSNADTDTTEEHRGPSSNLGLPPPYSDSSYSDSPYASLLSASDQTLPLYSVNVPYQHASVYFDDDEIDVESAYVVLNGPAPFTDYEHHVCRQLGETDFEVEESDGNANERADVELGGAAPPGYSRYCVKSWMDRMRRRYGEGFWLVYVVGAWAALLGTVILISLVKWI